MHSQCCTIASPSVTKQETFPTAGLFLKRCAYSRAKGPGETQTVGPHRHEHFGVPFTHAMGL